MERRLPASFHKKLSTSRTKTHLTKRNGNRLPTEGALERPPQAWILVCAVVGSDEENTHCPPRCSKFLHQTAVNVFLSNNRPCVSGLSLFASIFCWWLCSSAFRLTWLLPNLMNTPAGTLVGWPNVFVFARLLYICEDYICLFLPSQRSHGFSVLSTFSKFAVFSGEFTQPVSS